MLILIETRKLHPRGIGLVDVHLLGSALLAGAEFFTYDTRLRSMAASIVGH